MWFAYLVIYVFMMCDIKKKETCVHKIWHFQ
jgi:hypothetical protein